MKALKIQNHSAPWWSTIAEAKARKKTSLTFAMSLQNLKIVVTQEWEFIYKFKNIHFNVVFHELEWGYSEDARGCGGLAAGSQHRARGWPPHLLPGRQLSWQVGPPMTSKLGLGETERGEAETKKSERRKTMKNWIYDNAVHFVQCTVHCTILLTLWKHLATDDNHTLILW